MDIIYEEKLSDRISFNVIFDDERQICYTYLFLTLRRGTCLSSKQFRRDNSPPSQDEIASWREWAIDKMTAL